MQLIKIESATIGNITLQTVNARELHAFLEVGTLFKDWIARRIEEYGFLDGKDFSSYLSESSGGRPAKEYDLSIDMAKELAMVERNDKGKQARQYFIECERRANGLLTAFDMQAAMEQLARTMLPAMVETALAADPRRAVMNYVSVRQILEEGKALQKGRRSINRKIGYDLKIRALLERPQVPVLKCPHSGVWLYPRVFAANYMLARGDQLVKDHNAKVLGQGVFKLVPKTPAPADFAQPPL